MTQPKNDSAGNAGPQEVLPVGWGWLLLGAALAWALINLHWGRSVSWDEFEYLKATDWVRRGAVPYRDFFEHHTPLVWYVMAPVEALSHGPGVGPVLLLRWAQVPLWGLCCWRIWLWMRADGVLLWVRLSAMSALLATPFFVLPALEYRVDTLGTVLIILGLDQLRSGGTRSHIVAGAVLTLATIANLRFAPFTAAVGVISCFLDLEEGRWRFRASWPIFLLTGAVVALLPWVFFLLWTHSLGDMWHWCVVQNAAVSSVIPPQRSTLYWLSSPFWNFDIAGMALEVGLVVGGGIALRKLRRPGFLHLLLIAQVINLAFVAIMKVQYLYHFELTLCLSVPFLAMTLSGMAKRFSNVGQFALSCFLVFGLGVGVDLLNLSARNDHDSLVFQDATLRRAASLLRPGDKVFDGCGYLPSATPAYRYWFLPLLVRDLSLLGKLQPYTREAFMEDPPALVIASFRLGNWSAEWPDTGKQLITHYLPTLPNIWVPGLSYPFTSDRRQWTWSVPKSARYKLLCSPQLSEHPWFSAPFMVVSQETRMAGRFSIHPKVLECQGAEELSWELNGSPVRIEGGQVVLHRGDRLTARYSGKGPLGMMLVPDDIDTLFEGVDSDVNLDNIHINEYYRPL